MLDFAFFHLVFDDFRQDFFEYSLQIGHCRSPYSKSVTGALALPSISLVLRDPG